VHRNPYPFMGGELRRPEYQRLVTTASGVAAVMGAAG
jgi:copper homeostasis protein